MKRILFSITVFCFALLQAGAAPIPTDSTGNPGDNLDLYGVLDQFKKSENLEDFEKAINSESNKLNNLDLNKDGETDYIKVLDHADSSVHAIVLQVAINETENQDVAVIEIEKNDDESAKIQVIGDEDLYGKDYIVEPYENYVSKEEYDAQSQQNNGNVSNNNNTRTVVNVWAWPSVRYVYGPVYRPWRSPWYWRHYPGWWRPWRPHPWHVYHGYVVGYHHPYYHRVYHHRNRVAHRVYYRNRNSSATVRNTYTVRNQPRTNRYDSRTGNRNQPRERVNGRQPRERVQSQPRERVNREPRQRTNAPRTQPRGNRSNGGKRSGQHSGGRR